MIKISRLADYAVVILSALAGQPEHSASASALAEATGLPEPTVAKVLKALVRAEILDSVRGAAGGYHFKAEPEKLSVADIVTAIDGPIALTSCVEPESGDCSISGRCALNGRWDVVNDAVRSCLEQITLSAMMGMGCTAGCSKTAKGS